MKITWLTVGILAVAGTMAAPVRSEAAVRFGIVLAGHGDYRPGAYRAGYDRGSNDGVREGNHDGRQGESFSFWDEGRYRRAGYHSRYGSRSAFQAGYRRGFEAGYRRAYYACFRDGGRHSGGNAYGYGDDRAYKNGNDGRNDDYQNDYQNDYQDDRQYDRR